MPATQHTRSMCTGHVHSETSKFLNLHKYLPSIATHCTVEVKLCSLTLSHAKTVPLQKEENLEKSLWVAKDSVLLQGQRKN